jgi:hypothetical protein
MTLPSRCKTPVRPAPADRSNGAALPLCLTRVQESEHA